MDGRIDNNCAQRKATPGHVFARLSAKDALRFAWATGAKVMTKLE